MFPHHKTVIWVKDFIKMLEFDITTRPLNLIINSIVSSPAEEYNAAHQPPDQPWQQRVSLAAKLLFLSISPLIIKLTHIQYVTTLFFWHSLTFCAEMPYNPEQSKMVADESNSVSSRSFFFFIFSDLTTLCFRGKWKLEVEVSWSN